MGMAIEVNAAVMRLVPHTLAVVEKYNHLTADLQLSIVLDAEDAALLEKVLSMLDNHLIMITELEKDATIEAPKKLTELFVRLEREVSVMVDLIIRLDSFVPLLNHQLIHLIHIFEGTIRILDDVGMPKMSV